MMNIEEMICEAMKQEGISDPESEEGIDFCVERCPYPSGCILFETSHREQKLELMKEFSKRLYNHGVSVKDISLITGRSTRTVRRYLELC